MEVQERDQRLTGADDQRADEARLLAFLVFGWLSGFAALALVRYRFAFLRLPLIVQSRWVILTWAIHLTAFAVMLIFMFLL